MPVVVCFILLSGMPKGVFKNSLNSQWLSQDLAGRLLGWYGVVWAKDVSKSRSYNARMNSSERSIVSNKQIPRWRVR